MNEIIDHMGVTRRVRLETDPRVIEAALAAVAGQEMTRESIVRVISAIVTNGIRVVIS